MTKYNNGSRNKGVHRIFDWGGGEILWKKKYRAEREKCPASSAKTREERKGKKHQATYVKEGENLKVGPFLLIPPKKRKETSGNICKRGGISKRETFPPYSQKIPFWLALAPYVYRPCLEVYKRAGISSQHVSNASS